MPIALVRCGSLLVWRHSGRETGETRHRHGYCVRDRDCFVCWARLRCGGRESDALGPEVRVW